MGGMYTYDLQKLNGVVNKLLMGRGADSVGGAFNTCTRARAFEMRVVGWMPHVQVVF